MSTLMPQRLVRRWLAPFDCFLAWTQFLEQKFEGIGVPAQKIHRTTLGLNPERFPEVAAKSVGDPIFYFFGLLTPGRGALDAVEAFALVQDQLPSAKLVIADRQHQLVRDRSYLGAKRVELGERLKALGLQDNVIIRGFVPNVLGSMREADVVVLPFRSSAGYSQPPLTVLESLALGLPVVSSNVGCISEVVPPPPHGFLVEPRSPAQLAEAMITAWRTDNDSLRLERRQHILAKFSWPRSVDLIEAEYSILANSK
jgi:glycosyltransferase involved in cell wall biosynthesis